MIEVELLRLSLVSISSDDEVSASDFNDSAHPHLGHNIEWSISEESEVAIQSLDGFSGYGIAVTNSPFLVGSVVSIGNSNISSFSIMATLNFKNLLVMNIGELIVSIIEELEPAGISVPHLHVVGSSRALDIE